MNRNLTSKAQQFRRNHNLVGGVVVIHNGEVEAWMNELRNPERWIPGCIAIDDAGNQYVAKGGNTQDGARGWEQLA